jgi:hypothetical protein
MPPPHSAVSNGVEGKKTIRQLSYLLNTATADLFLFQRGEIGAGGPLAVPGRPHEELGLGHLNHQQKRVRRRLSAVDRLLRNVPPYHL